MSETLMEAKTYTTGPSPIFDGEEYELCAARMISVILNHWIMGRQ